jgi:hypothetical protein
MLKRFLILLTEEHVQDVDFCQKVWNSNNFDSNMVKLLKGGDCWRIKKSLELIQNIVDNDLAYDLTVNVNFSIH